MKTIVLKFEHESFETLEKLKRTTSYKLLFSLIYFELVCYIIINNRKITIREQEQNCNQETKDHKV